jgi:hypothetical protein
MKLKVLSEIAPSDLMPDTSDPYLEEPPEIEEPDAGLEEPMEPEVEEPAPADDIPLGPEAAPGPEALEPIPEPLPTWAPEEATDRRDTSLRHDEGFHLRMRPYGSSDNRWLAQLYTDDGKILDKGYVDVPLSADPQQYIIDMTCPNSLSDLFFCASVNIFLY